MSLASKLTEMSSSELDELSKSELMMDEFLEASPELEYFNNERDKLLIKNENLARENLELKPQIEEKKQSILEKLDELTMLKMEFDNQSKTFDILSDVYTPTNLQDRLRVASLESEEESEKVADDFLKGELPVDKFLSLFMKERQLSHVRRTKEEKLHQQIQELQRSCY